MYHLRAAASKSYRKQSYDWLRNLLGGIGRVDCIYPPRPGPNTLGGKLEVDQNLAVSDCARRVLEGWLHELSWVSMLKQGLHDE